MTESMDIERTLETLAAAGIVLAVQDGKLVCKARAGALTPERRQWIASHKEQLMAFLVQGAAAAAPMAPQVSARREGPVRLSPAQQRLWFIDQLTESGVNYTIPVIFRLRGVLDAAALHRSIQAIIDRHESLRTLIRTQDNQPIAEVLAHADIHLGLHSLEDLDGQGGEQRVWHLVDEALDKPFNLAQEIPIRLQLLRLAADHHILLLTLHHIASDGWSVENLLRELTMRYRGEVTRQAVQLPALPLQYADYVEWLDQWLHGERLQQELGFWRTQLAGAPVAHGLPLDRPRPAHAIHGGAAHRQRLPRTLLQQLVDLGRRHGVTLFMTLQAAFAVLVARWSGQTDVVIGTPVANRPRNELAPLVGFFANTLALRSVFADDPTFIEVLQQTKQQVLEAFRYQHLPFEVLVEDLNPPRSLSLPPLIQLMFSLQDIDEGAALDLPGIQAEALIPESRNAKFDLNLSLFETTDGLEACWDYCSDLFRAETIAGMAASFEALLQGIVAAPERRIQQLPLQSRAGLPFAEANDTERPLPAVIGVHALFESRAASMPDAVAVRDGGQAIGYAALNQRANRVAHALRALGVGPDARVALHVERGIDLVVGLLAILKAGGAYVPLDPAHPPERLAALLADSGAMALLTQSGLSPGLAAPSLPRLLLDDEATAAAFEDADPQVQELGRHHLAYVIYTSGSTGTPKGVMVEHGNLLNLVDHCTRQFADDGVIQASLWTRFSFDVSAFEIFVPLALGATLHIVPDPIRPDADALLQWLIDRRITLAYLPPFVVRALREQPDDRIAALSLRRLLVGVEPLSENELHRLRTLRPGLRLVNGYGPSETTVFSTAYDDIGNRFRPAPIGRPIANTRVRVLDEAGQPVPVGAVGELHIAGLGVARGYLNRPELTAHCFLIDADGQRLYRTGDLARWLPEGQLEFRGRKDQQLKLNGVRIEPFEIEAALCRHPAIRQAAVVVREDHGPDSRRLVAYVVPRDNADIQADALREDLLARLPAYLVPAAFVPLEALPLTVSGKLDLRALPPPDATAYSIAGYVPPVTALEQQLAALWQELLQHPRISATASFFDLGGHSLNAVKLMSSIRELTGKSLPISLLFKAPTVRGLADQIGSYVAEDDSFVALRDRGDDPPLFVFHAAGGDVLCYQPLLRYLPPETPVYGFHRSELPRQRVPRFKSIEALAEEYVERILQQQPGGPYQLAGWSSGGLLALEIAALLERRGCAVAMVALVDTMLATGTDVPESIRERGLQALQQLSDEAACELMREFDPTLPAVTPVDHSLPLSAEDYFNYLVAANQIGLDFHRPQFTLDAPVHYFGCRQNNTLLTVSGRVAQLQALARRPITCLDFDATHFSIMEEPSVALLGEAIARTMAECREPAPTA